MMSNIIVIIETIAFLLGLVVIALFCVITIARAMSTYRKDVKNFSKQLAFEFIVACVGLVVLAVILSWIWATTHA